jgi:hypothetical protein
MKRLIIALLAFIALIIAGLVWFNRSTTGELTITSSPNAEIYLLQTPKEPEKLGRGQASVRLKSGSYTVEAAEGASRSRATAMVETGQTTTLRLSLSPSKQPATIAQYTARHIFEGPGYIDFLNAGARQLYQLSQGQTIARRLHPEVYPIISVHWFTSGEALVEQPDSRYRFVSQQGISDVSLPGVRTGDEGSNLGALAANRRGQIAYVAGTQLYYKDHPTAPAKPLLKLEEPGQLQLSPTGLLAVYFTPEESAHSDRPAPKPFIINPQTKQITQLPPSAQAAEFISWNPAGDHLFYYSASTGYAYYPASGKTETLLYKRITNATSFTWTSDSRLLYLDDRAVWSLDTKSSISSLLASLTGHISQSQPFTLSRDGKSIIFGTDAPGGYGSVGTIYRLPL